MHAKNTSFLRHSDGTAELAPAYDVAMHLHHPSATRLSALDVNGKYRMDDIDATDLVAEGVSWGLPVHRARTIAAATVRQLRAALDSVEREKYLGVSGTAIDTVRERVNVARRDIDTERDSGGSPIAQQRRRGPRRPPNA